MYIYILYKRHIFTKANCINLQSIFTAIITIFTGLLDISFIRQKILINCVVSTIEVMKPKFKDIINVYGQKECETNKNVYSDNSMGNASINFILMLIIQLICTIYLFYSFMNQLTIDKQPINIIIIFKYLHQKYIYNQSMKWLYVNLHVIFTLIMTLLITLYGVFIRFKSLLINCIVCYCLSLSHAIMIY